MSEANEVKKDADYDEVHRLLAQVSPQYPSLTLDEMHEIFDATYDRCCGEIRAESQEIEK